MINGIEGMHGNTYISTSTATNCGRPTASLLPMILPSLCSGPLSDVELVSIKLDYPCPRYSHVESQSILNIVTTLHSSTATVKDVKRIFHLFSIS
jgi:hypothetical protein